MKSLLAALALSVALPFAAYADDPGAMDPCKSKDEVAARNAEIKDQLDGKEGLEVIVIDPTEATDFFKKSEARILAAFPERAHPEAAMFSAVAINKDGQPFRLFVITGDKDGNFCAAERFTDTEIETLTSGDKPGT
jgi:hypothetical protein